MEKEQISQLFFCSPVAVVYLKTAGKRVDRFKKGYDMNSCKVECSIKMQYLIKDGSFG